MDSLFIAWNRKCKFGDFHRFFFHGCYLTPPYRASCLDQSRSLATFPLLD